MKPKMWWLKRSSCPHLFARYLMLFCALGVIFLPTSYVWANPTGEQVVGGAATFQRDGNKLTVNQSTDRLAVNWQSFNIAAGEQTHFNMPSSTSAALNRVIGGNPSSIYGSLSANGILYLINPSGILVGPGGTVNAASFMASTLDVSTEQFMNAKNGAGMSFVGSSGESIINQGNITAEKGDVFLIAQKVENRGTINAANGTAGMVGSGQNTDVMVHEVGGKGFAIRVAQLQGEAATGSNRDLPDGEELLNEGSINAAQAELNASGNVYALAIRNSGTIRAKAVVANADGTVRLDGGVGDVMNTGTMIAKNAGNESTAAGGKIDVAGQNITASPESIITAAGGDLGGNGGSVKIDSQDTTIVQGKVDVTAASAGAKGGKVQLLGERVGLFDGAKVNASGGAGGGTVLVGGDYLGGQSPKPELKDLAKLESEPVKNAKATVMADTAEIKADATVNGDGGKIILWSDEYTGFYGDLFARGGVAGGNGGFIETSSKNNLQAFGLVNTGASLGRSGNWLLDPTDLTIKAGSNVNGDFVGIPATTWETDVFDPLTGVQYDIATVGITPLLAALAAGSVTISTTSTGGGNGDITVSGDITYTGPNSLTLIADADIIVDNSITMGNVVGPSYVSGDISLIATGDITINAAITIGIGDVTLNTSGGNIVLNNDITSRGNVSLNGEIITLNGGINVSDATGSSSDPGGESVGGVTIDATGAVSGSGVISLAQYYNPTTGAADAIDGGLVIRSTGGGVQAVINTPVSFDQTDPSDIWDPKDAGPPIAVSAGGAVNLVNQGDPGSTLTVGSFDGTGGITSTGAVTLAAGNGNLILGLGANTVSGASFIGSSDETTSGIIFAGVSSRLNPAVNTTGRQTYAGVVTLNTGGLTVLSGAGMDFRQTINDGSINTTLSGTTSGGVAVEKHIATTGSESLLLLNTGVTRLQGLVGTALVPATTTPTVNLAYLSLGPLASFGQDGGTVEFLETGTASAPETNGAGLALNGFTTGPSIYTTGYLSFGLGAAILLSANTYLSAFKDIYFGGTVDTRTGPNAPYTFNVTTIDDSATPGTTIGGGQIIFDGAIGATGPLGALTVTAAGTDGNGKGSQININAGATTFTGTNPIPGLANEGNGAITLTADGVVILAGAIQTNSSETIGGGLTVRSNFNNYASVTDNNNIQIDGTINTRGGAINFESPVFFTGASTLDTTVGNSGGAITFVGSMDGSADATMNSGTAQILFGDTIGSDSDFNLNITGAGGVMFMGPVILGSGQNTITSLAGDVGFMNTLNGRSAATLTMNLGGSLAQFNGKVGDETPLAMVVTSSGDVTFEDTVRMGGAFRFEQLSGSFTANSSISGGFGLTINPINAGATVTLQEVGTQLVGGVETLVPVASLTIGNGNSAIFLNGNITTSGGAINFGSPVTANETLTLQTTGRGAAGGGLSILNSFTATQGLTIETGSGAIIFGDKVAATGAFRVESAGEMSFTQTGSVTAGSIFINTSVTSQGNVTLKTTNGDLEIVGGVSARPSDSFGKGGTATLTSFEDIVVNGVIDVSGRSGTFIFVLPDGSGTYNVSTVGYDGGEVVLTAGYREVPVTPPPVGQVRVGSINANGGNNFASGGNAGNGGSITILSGSGVQISTIQSNGGGAGRLGGTGGTLRVTRTGAVGDFSISSVSSVGGDGDNQGGRGGDIYLTATTGNLQAPVNFINQGGEATSLNANIEDLFSGDGGLVSLNSTAGTVYFQNQALTLYGNSKLEIAAGQSIVLATDLVNRSSGVVITANENALKDARGSMVMKYGSGEFFMPSSSYLVTQGGDSKIYSTTTGAGAVTISGISTTGENVKGGSIFIHQEVGSVFGEVSVSGALETFGGTPVLPRYGRAGGSVAISGTTVSVSDINTSGSASLSSASAPAFGGAGGSITITGDTITITSGTSSGGTSFSMNTSGGAGLGVSNSRGGSGGSITLNGDVVLSSGDGTRTTVILNTQGGTFTGGSFNGVGGNVTVTGSLTGTKTTSNTLDLRYGSGTVTLGTLPGNTITLGTLITAADDSRSTGNLIINGSLDLGTLTTYARGYGIQINGGGTIANAVTFNNTGTVAIGISGGTTTFTSGFDASATDTTQLKGTIVTGTSADPGKGTPMTFGVVELVGNTVLDSNGSNVSIGTIDGAANLTFASGVGAGAVTISSNVGANERVGTILVSAGITQTVLFGGSVTAEDLTGEIGTELSFDGNVDLTGGANLLGLTKLNNTLFDTQNTTLSFIAGTDSRLVDVDLSSGPILIGGDANYSFEGFFEGAQNLTLSGVGNKTFSGEVGKKTAIGTGIGAAITMSGGDVTFGALTTASGLASTTADVIFNGIATLGAGNTGTTLNSNVTLSGATINSAGSVVLGDSAGDAITLTTGTVTLTGAGGYTVNGTVAGTQQLALAGAGTKTFASAANVTGFTQAAGSGTVTFQNNVITTGSSNFRASTVLDGMVFSTTGKVTLGNALTDSITLRSAAVTLTGTGTFDVNGVVVGGGQNLTLSGLGEKTFAGGMSGLGTLALTAGTGTFNSTVKGVSFNQSGGVAVLNGNGTFTGASTLGGTSTTLNGITFSSGTTAVTGGLTSTGATTMTGGVITLDTTTALTSSSSGTLTLGSAVTLSRDTTLDGAGAYQLNGAVNGANDLTLTGTGAKTFSGAVGTGTALSTITQNDASGLVTFAENVTMSGDGDFNANVVLDGLTMTGSTLTFGSATTDTAVISGATTITAGQDINLISATTLNAALILNDAVSGAGTTTLSGTVTGASSNLAITTDDLVVGNTVQTGSGVVSLVKKNGDNLQVGGTTGFLDAAEISEISTSGGLTVATVGDITINQLVSEDTDQITGAFRMVTGGGILVNETVELNIFSGLAGGALTATGGDLSALLLTRGFEDLKLGAGGLVYDAPTSMTLSRVQAADDIVVTSVNSMTVNGSITSRAGDIGLGSLSSLTVGGTVTASGSVVLGAVGDIQVSSRVTAPTGIFVESDGYFINSFNGNPFKSADTRVVTSDLFGASWPSNGAVPGLQVVYGVNSIEQVGANQIGVSTTLLAGNAAPYILEFTTGTGQPYIFAQQAAIPPVMLPAALTGGNGFAKTVSYSADEVEMMTPEERSAYENQQRQVSARVILQGESGEGEEIGAPAEGRTPQAAIPAVQIPVAPTAQVLLDGKPLAGATSDQERGDAKRSPKDWATRAVVIPSGLNVGEVIESERIAAEVSVGSAPVVQNR
jgi:filamentous hemagglutinin family protein